MAMRTFRRTRRTFRPRFRARRFRRPFARASYDKIVLFNNLNGGQNTLSDGTTPNFNCGPITKNLCGFQDGDCGGTTACGESPPGTPVTCNCCENVLELNLVSNTTLESFYQDSFTIVSLYGDVYFRNNLAAPRASQLCNPANDLFWSVYANTYRESYFLGLRKHLLSQDTVEQDLDPANLTTDFDWLESSPPWIWNRSGVWGPREKHNQTRLTQGSIIGTCSDTSGGSLLNALVGGTGNINTQVTTTCDVKQAPSEGCPQVFNAIEVDMPPWHHYRLRIRKHIRMQRDQALNLHLDMRLPSALDGFPAFNCFDPGILGWGPGVNNIVTWECYARIGATIRLH